MCEDDHCVCVCWGFADRSAVVSVGCHRFDVGLCISGQDCECVHSRDREGGGDLGPNPLHHLVVDLEA